MPRHMLPQTGTIVSYFADPTRRPMAAIVTKKISKTSVNLSVFDAEAGTVSAKLGVTLMDMGTAPASGAFCTPLVTADPVTDGSTDVQSASQRATAVASIVAGGSGYVVGDILTVTTGGGATIRVSTVSTGAVTAATVVNPGNVKKPGPAGTLATTGGTGTGCTVTITWTDN